MNENFVKYKASRKNLRETQPAFLLSFFDKLVPGGKFRFITFEQDDYRQASLTFLFCLDIPAKVMMSVLRPMDVEPAIREVIRLNKNIIWDSVEFVYLNSATNAGPISVELRLQGFLLEINGTGDLVRKRQHVI